MTTFSAASAPERTPTYPFSAVVGHEDLALALVLNAIAPRIGGVLVRGEKGTAKSTMVRALAALLPDQEAWADCRFGCAPATPDADCPDVERHAGATRLRRTPLVELPLGATEDRVVGSLDVARMLREGASAFQPGVLAAANRGVLYVDEVNLLGDHLVDLLLDAAAMGRVRTERESVSVSHPADFFLVGTMNPEEGELRPQLLDRFGLSVELAASRDPAVRAEVVRRRLTFEQDPAGFAAAWADTDADLGRRILAARKLLPEVVLGDGALRMVATVCAELEVDGMRADLVTARAATAHAAWSGRAVVTVDDVTAAARLALPHRRRRNPFDAPGLDQQQLDELLDRLGSDEETDPDPEGPDPGPDGGGGAPGPGSDENPEPAAPPESAGASAQQQPPAPAGEPFRARRLQRGGQGTGPAGRRAPVITSRGMRVRAGRGGTGSFDVTGTVLAAVPHQHVRGRRQGALRLAGDDIRRSVRRGRESNLVVFVVDVSGSMAARARIRAVKGAVASLLVDAYQRRDKVAVVTFRRDGAEVVLPPTSAVEVARARLDQVPTGGRTPLAAALLRTGELLRREATKERRRPLVVLLTDGRHTHGPDPVTVDAGLPPGAVVLVDCESGPVRTGLNHRLATALRAQPVRLEELHSDALSGLVRGALDPRRVA